MVLESFYGGDKMIKAVIFDMDGVLFDTERVYDISWKEAAKELKIEDVEGLLASCRGVNEKDIEKIFKDKYGERLSYRETFDYVNSISDRKMKDTGVPVKVGVYEILNYLKDNDYIIALASSTKKKKVLRYLKEANILNFFDVIITGDMIEQGKPAPDIYLRTAKEIEEKPENCIAIEDSFNGIKSAYRAGMKTIMVPDLVMPTEEIDKLLYKKFNSLLEVKDFLQECNK